MPNESIVCPKCNAAMEEGFILDSREYRSLTTVIQWIEGAPEYDHSFWNGGFKVSGRRKFQVTTYRCADCGYLESYAPLRPVSEP
jgi:Domain of unknown function (DUF6487)